MCVRRSSISVSAAGRQRGMIVLAVGLAVSLCGGLPSAAQASESERIPLGQLIAPDVAEVIPDAGGKLVDVIRRHEGGPTGDCYPTAGMGVEIGMGPTEGADDLFLEALFRARRDQLLAFLRNRGLDSGQLAFRPTDGPDGTGQVETGQFKLSDDTQAPELKVTSAPRKGTKVGPGDIIRVTIRARERKSDFLRDGPQSGGATSGWQSGIANIQLTADDGLVEHKDYGRLPDPCSPGYLKRVLETSYTVPANPPPIVRLTAIVSDYAGNQNFEIGEFPTGEWYGKQEWKARAETGDGSWTQDSVSIDLVLDHDGKGNLVGTAVGTLLHEGFSTQPLPGCSANMKTTTPGKARARLVGSYTPERETMSVQFADIETITETRVTPCYGVSGGTPAARAFAEQQTLQHLKRQLDGSFRASGRWPNVTSEATLRRAGK